MSAPPPYKDNKAAHSGPTNKAMPVPSSKPLPVDQIHSASRLEELIQQLKHTQEAYGKVDPPNARTACLSPCRFTAEFILNGKIFDVHVELKPTDLTSNNKVAAGFNEIDVTSRFYHPPHGTRQGFVAIRAGLVTVPHDGSTWARFTRSLPNAEKAEIAASAEGVSFEFGPFATTSLPGAYAWTDCVPSLNHESSGFVMRPVCAAYSGIGTQTAKRAWIMHFVDLQIIVDNTYVLCSLQIARPAIEAGVLNTPTVPAFGQVTKGQGPRTVRYHPDHHCLITMDARAL